jgi:hypothetical protein
MRRRAFLRSLGVGLSLGTVGVTTADPTAETATFTPTGRVGIPGAAEAVVDDAGKTAYVATGDGFATVDVSSPSTPTVLTRVTDIAADREDGPLRSILDVKLDGDRLLVSGPAQRGRLDGLQVFDVSDPTDPTPATAFFETGYGIHNSFLLDGYAYLTNNAGFDRPMVVLDVSADPIEEVGRWSPLDADVDVPGWADLPSVPGTIHDLYVQDDTAYCAYWDAGTWLVDVSERSSPSFVGHAGAYSLEELVELSEDGTRFARLFGEAPGNDHYVTVNEDASLMAVGGEGWDNPDTEVSGPGGIRLYDVTDPTNPREVSRIDPPAAADTTRSGTWVTSHNFDLRDGRLYSSWYQGGVKIHDLSDPTTPRQMAWWRDPETARFWTARSAVIDDFFIASSYDLGTTEGGLYTFPDRAGEQPDPPSLTASEAETGATTTAAENPTTDETTTTPTTVTTHETTASATTTAAEARRQPGFGVGAALTALGVGAYRYLHDGEEKR